MSSSNQSNNGFPTKTQLTLLLNLGNTYLPRSCRIQKTNYASLSKVCIRQRFKLAAYKQSNDRKKINDRVGEADLYVQRMQGLQVKVQSRASSSGRKRPDK
ncbi:uncharacterized protein LOC112518437 isoform X2 [Cynara cardunculus var. scolymus]|uniref:uncharacterized protein LOC112518437 isoform X2 n=1 Tax=Cynara cardunculus var. scolymus TaxID=59895 RepID=UPI000D629575|nr:uncharacterized protein LOC112518437 isoform X2 [Cynara cardunculus var. scolymus]